MKMNRLLQACIAVVIILTAVQLPVWAQATGQRPLWNAAWITDTQTAYCWFVVVFVGFILRTDVLSSSDHRDNV